MAANMEAAMFIMFYMHACVCTCVCVHVHVYTCVGGTPTQPHPHSPTHLPPGRVPLKSVKMQ